MIQTGYSQRGYEVKLLNRKEKRVKEDKNIRGIVSDSKLTIDEYKMNILMNMLMNILVNILQRRTNLG